MPSYAQLATEQVWNDQYVPDNLTSLLVEPLRAFFDMGPAAIGAPGDNNHLDGRHRSAAWDRESRYSTSRTYGTVDGRDRQGDQNWYRAVDTGIQGEALYAASHRMDELVRSGQAPGVAEWFGTFDGVNVVGWFQGGPSSSDDSHLWHLHVGFWNEYANDPATLQAVFNAITGEDDMPTAEEIAAAVWTLKWRSNDQSNPNNAMMGDIHFVTNKFAADVNNQTVTAPALRTQLSDIKAALKHLQESVDALEFGAGAGTVAHTHVVGPTGPAIPDA